VLRVSTPAWCPFCLSRAPLAARVDYQTGLYRPVHAGDPNPASNQKAGTLADRDFEVGYLSRHRRAGVHPYSARIETTVFWLCTDSFFQKAKGVWFLCEWFVRDQFTSSSTCDERIWRVKENRPNRSQTIVRLDVWCLHNLVQSGMGIGQWGRELHVLLEGWCDTGEVWVNGFVDGGPVLRDAAKPRLLERQFHFVCFQQLFWGGWDLLLCPSDVQCMLWCFCSWFELIYRVHARQRGPHQEPCVHGTRSARLCLDQRCPFVGVTIDRCVQVGTRAFFCSCFEGHLETWPR